MAAPKEAADKSKAKSGKGSKAACEAAGWKFAPLASIGASPFAPNGNNIRFRYEGSRGTMVIPPAGSGIEPRQFGGSGLAVRWAVEQLGQIAKQPDEAPAGMEGVQLLLAAALASGEMCGGPDETPERPDAELLSICRDAIEADKAEDAYRATPSRSWGCAQRENNILSGALKAKREAVEPLTRLHATTREGLLQKARAALALQAGCYITGTMSADIFKSLAVDLIHLVPTLIDERGRPTVPPADDAEVV